MPIQISDDGYWEQEYTGPYKGLNTKSPEILLDPSETPAVRNFTFRNNELRSRPVFVRLFATPDNVNPNLGFFSFRDINFQLHTVGWTARGMFQLSSNTPPDKNPWSLVGGPPLNPSVPISYRVFNSQVYWTNGNPQLSSWDGIQLAPTNTVTTIPVGDSPTVIPGSTGPLTFGGLYLAELDNHLLLANVTALDTATQVVYSFPQRLWWSANGIPNVWDFAANTNAGENDFLDVPDIITGMITLGTQGYLFRSNGITQFAPTGAGILPFAFDHLWASDHGVGNVYPWSIAQYGPFGMFISTEQIYQMSVNSFNDVGGGARDAIMADLASPFLSGNPVGVIVPSFAYGYIFFSYQLYVPFTTTTRVYVYDLEEKNWTLWDTGNVVTTGKPEECWT